MKINLPFFQKSVLISGSDKERTAVVIAAYLAFSKNMGAEKAIKEVENKHWNITKEYKHVARQYVASLNTCTWQKRGKKNKTKK